MDWLLELNLATAAAVLLSLVAVAAYWSLREARRIGKDFSTKLQDEDGKDAMLANSQLRMLRKGMMILEIARNPELIRADMEERSRTNRIIRKSQRGDGLTHLEMPHSTLEASVSAGLRAEPSPVNASSASLAAAAAVAASARPAGSVTSPPSGGTTGAAPGATAAGDAEAPEAHWARVLGEIEILSQLDRPHLEDLAQLAAMRHVKRGERLRAPHAPAAALTVVLKGEVALWRSEDERRRTADGPDLASRLGAGFVASLAAAEGSGGGVVDAFAAGFAAGSEPTPQDETSGIGSWAGDTGGAGGFGGNPSRREAAPTPIRVFGAGCRCSSFLDLLLGLLTPASCLPMPQAFAGLGGPPAHASHPSVLAASAAGPCSILEISADALAQLAQRNRALVQGLAEVVLLRLSLVTCDALASYIELPLHLSPKPALPPPPPPPQGGWRARAAEMHAAGIPKGETATRGHAGGSGGASSSCGNGMGLSLGNSLAGLMAPAGGAGQRGPVWAGEVGAGAGSAASASATKGCADSPAPAPTPAGPANARAALLAHACKWVRSALHVSPEDDLPAELLYLAPGESYFPAAHAPTVLVHLWGRARAQPVPLPGAEGGEPKQNTSGDGGGGRDAGSGVAGQPPPPPHVPALGEVRKGARWLSAGEVLGLRSVLTRQHLAEGVAVPGGGKPTRAGVGASLGSSPGSPVPAGAPFCRPAGLTPGAEAGGGGGGSSRSSGASGSRSSGHNGGSGGSVLASVAAGLASVDVSGTGNAGRSAPEPSPTGAECGAFLLVLSTAALRSLCRRRPAVLLRLGAMLLHSLPPLLWTLDHCVEWRVLRSGDHAEVPTEEVVVLVLCGRLRIFPCAPTKDSTEQQGAPVAADEMRGSELLGPRDSYGEDDVLLCKPQARRAIAVRDTQLIYLSGSVIRAITATYPTLPLALGRRLALRSHRPSSSLASLSPLPPAPPPLAPSSPPVQTVCLLPLSASDELGAALDYTVGALSAALRAMRVRAAALSSNALHEELDTALATFAPFGEIQLSLHLAARETRHQLLIYRADPFPSDWTRRCLRQADLVLLVGLATDEEDQASTSPPTTRPGATQAEASKPVAGVGAPPYMLQPIETLLEGSSAPAARELLLLHRDPRSKPKGTRAWLEQRSGIRTHHHVRLHIDNPTFDAQHYLSDVHRLARSLAGMTFGLVLGGGGARGLAHLGVLRALREEGVPIDLIGGTSQGAFMSAAWAVHDDPYDPIGSLPTVRSIVRTFAAAMSSSSFYLRDLTLPITSYFSGEGFNRAIVTALGAAKIEDSVTPFFCVTTDLQTSSAVVHRNGAMWKYVRASMSLTGYLPPMCDVLPGAGGRPVVHLLCDGGYVNNLPADVMQRELGAGTILAVDVGSAAPFVYRDYGPSLRGMTLLLRRLAAWVLGYDGPGDPPSMAAIASQLAFLSAEWQRDEARARHIDVYMRPPLTKYGLLDYAKLSEIQTIGYTHAKTALQKWKRELRMRNDPRVVIFDLADNAVGIPRLPASASTTFKAPVAGGRRSLWEAIGSPRPARRSPRGAAEPGSGLVWRGRRLGSRLADQVEAVRHGLVSARRSHSFAATKTRRSWDLEIDNPLR